MVDGARSFVGAALGLAATMLATAAHAQGAAPWTARVEIVGNVGNGQLHLGDSEWGNGVDIGFAAGVRPFEGALAGLGFEVQGSWLGDTTTRGAQVSSDLSARLFVAGALYHFRNAARVQPYVLGGLAIVSADYRYTCVDCVFDWDPALGAWVSRGAVVSEESGTEPGFALGGGVKVAVMRRVLIRPEVLLADTSAGAGYNWSWWQLKVGIGVGF